MSEIKYYLIISLIFININNLISQNIDFNQIKESTKLVVTGGVSANSVFYNSNFRNSREPFTYFLQGNLNFSWLTFSVPVSYSFTNQGGNLNYSIPFNFNRISLHPKYKWAQAHIGDVAMTFSPYTLSGHQFTGLGLDLQPKGAWSLSMMGGRLLKAVPYDGNPQSQPGYKRNGYGAKLGFKKDAYKFELIGFYAKDDENSIQLPDTINIDLSPKANVVTSAVAQFTLKKTVKVNLEYSLSAVTQDMRAAPGIKEKNLTNALLKPNSSTEYFNALKAGFNFNLDKMNLGLQYERIDPNYTTFGAYFFNNDFENITLNGSRPLFKDKVNLSFNIGFQRDDLDNQKTQSTSRAVGSINATWQMNKKMNLTTSYSSFTTYTNQKLNQFENINDSNLADEIEQQTNFKQLSKNANVNYNWNMSKTQNKPRNLNLNYSLAASANEQGGAIRQGQANNFHNSVATYTMGFPKSKISTSASANFTYADVSTDDQTYYGMSLGAAKKYWKDQMTTSLRLNYNISNNPGAKTNIANISLSSNMVYKERHNFNMTAIELLKSGTNSDFQSELTVTFGYAYNFTVKKPNIEFEKKERVKKEKTKKEKEEKTKEIDISGAVYDALKALQEEGAQATDRLNANYFKEKFGVDIDQVILAKGEYNFNFEEEILKTSDTELNTQEKVFLAHYYMMDKIQNIHSKKEMLESPYFQEFIQEKLAENPDYGDEPLSTIEIDIAKYFFGQVF